MIEDKPLEEVVSDIHVSVKRYIELRYQLIKLELTEQVARVVSSLTAIIITTIIGIGVLFFISMFGAFYFSEFYGSTTKGFGIIALVYLILFILFLIFGRSIIVKPMSKLIIVIMNKK
jgi:hypothetical protein